MPMQLLDTHALLWFLQDAPELPVRVAERIESEKWETWVSIVSVWEMAIKISLGKLAIPYSLDRELPSILRENGFKAVPVDVAHLGRLSELPFHHRDPFDRLLVAQALHEQFELVSRDAILDAYGIRRYWG